MRRFWLGSFLVLLAGIGWAESRYSVISGSFSYLYNTTDKTTNYERGGHWWSSNTFVVGTESGGTGAQRDLQLKAGNSKYIVLSNGGDRWYVQPTGHLQPTTSNTFDFGLSDNHVRNGYFGRSIQGSNCKTLTPGSATEFVRIAIPQTADSNFAAGEIIWTVYDADATDTQTLQGRTALNCANKAGTEGCAALVTALNTAVYPSGGAGKDDLACTFATVTGLTEQVGFSANCSTTEMTETTSKICYRLDMPQPNTVTPQ